MRGGDAVVVIPGTPAGGSVPCWYPRSEPRFDVEVQQRQFRAEMAVGLGED